MRISLGIDIGTTKVAAVIVDTDTRSLLDVKSQSTHADIAGRAEAFAEQNVEIIMDVCEKMIADLDAELRGRVTSIGVTGQMHGVVCWNSRKTGNLITWKDQRASADGTLPEIQAVPGCGRLKDGFGMTTLAWLARNNLLDGWTSCSTVHDHLVCQLCQLATPVTDPTNAASWGLFDISTLKWPLEIIGELRIPQQILPGLVACGSEVGKLSAKFADKLGLPSGIPVYAAIGDNQASILATAQNQQEEIYLTLGTGAQLSMVLQREQVECMTWPDSVEIRPFVDGAYLAVAAPLCGGQAFAWLVNTIQTWLQDLGSPAQDEYTLFRKADSLALEHLESPILFKPNFLGERHDPNARGAITNIDLQNFSLGNVAAGLGKGIVQNMFSMFPADSFAGRSKVIGSGNGVRNLKIIQEMIKRTFELPLELVESKEEAAVGAALLACGEKAGEQYNRIHDT